jgi:hypothetical protein
MLTESQLMEKWTPVLDHPDLPSITDFHKKRTVAVMLENQEKSLREDRLMETAVGNVAGQVGNYDPILIGLVRRSMPQLIAYDVCGVQPMSGPTGLIFAMKARYGTDDAADPYAREEALFKEADSDYTGAGTHAGTNPFDNRAAFGGSSTSGTGLESVKVGPDMTNGAHTGVAETRGAAGNLMPDMSFTIEKMSVTAKSRALQAGYTIELQQDLKQVHGLDAEAELSNILSSEITAEINREVIRTVYTAAKTGAANTTTAGTFDLDVDANGRWSVERFKGLMFQIEREANLIGQQTRRGRGNFLIVSADVASALAMAGVLDYKTAIQANLNVDDTSTTFAGMLNGKYKVYVDPYMSNGDNANQFCLVGYRGTSPFDAGVFYCPYVPLQLLRATDPATFQPKIGFKTRYGITGHPMADNATTGALNSNTLAQGSNSYFRIMRVTNLS